MNDAFEQLLREADKPTQVPEQIAKYAAALVAGTHEITSLTIRPKRTWVGLTEEEIEDAWQGLMATYIEEVDSSYWAGCDFEFARAIEAKLKEKNT